MEDQISLAPAARPSRLSILGVGVDDVTMDEALAHIGQMIKEGGTHMIVTADASMVVDAQADSELAEIISGADLVTPDGTGVLWAASKRGHPLRGKVSGVDLVDRVCGLSAEHGWRLVFLGSEPGVAEQAAERLRLRHPGCHIVGTRHGYFPAESDEIVAAEVGELDPDVLFVAMGIPRQEKFIQRHAALHKAKVAVGVGGSFDVHSGRAKRAPVFMQKMRLEWLWRLLLNPSKWRKAKKLPVFARKVWFGK